MIRHDRTPAALLIGHTRRSEFREPLRLLRARTRLRRAATMAEALELVGRSTAEPDLVVVVQSRPGEVDASAIESLRAAFPLARFVQLLGSWCEGETRSGDPWPAETRLFWHQFVPRMSDCLDRLAKGECPDWGLPPATTATDFLLATIPREEASADAGALIAIHTPHIATYETLADLFAFAAWRSVWTRPHRAGSAAGVTAGCFDGIGMDGDEIADLNRFGRQIDTKPVLVLLDFLRHDTERLALAAGAAKVFAKPYLIDDLLATMRQMIGAKASKDRRPERLTPRREFPVGP